MIRAALNSARRIQRAVHGMTGDAAVAACNEAIRQNPRDAISYYNLGVEHHRKNKYDQAIADYSKAIDINPKYADAYLGRGVAYSNKGEYDQEINDYRKAIEIDPKFALAYNNRGNARTERKEYDRAIADYDRAMDSDNRSMAQGHRDPPTSPKRANASHRRAFAGRGPRLFSGVVGQRAEAAELYVLSLVAHGRPCSCGAPRPGSMIRIPFLVMRRAIGIPEPGNLM